MEQSAVINQNHLDLVIDSIVKNTASTGKVISKVAEVIDTIIKKSKNIDSNLKKFKKLKDFVTDYCGVTTTIINTLCKDLPGGKELHKLLGYESKEDPNKKGKTIEKYTVVDSVVQISNIIENTLGIIEKISSFNSGFKTLFNIKKNIFLLKLVIGDLLKDLLSSFKEMAEDSGAQDILKYLVKDPDETITDVVNNIKKDGEFNMTDTSTTKTVIKQGKLGLLDVFEKTFSLVGLMGQMKVPNLLKMKIKMDKLINVLKVIFDDIVNIQKELITEKSILSLRMIGKAIVGDGNDGKNAGLLKICQKLTLIFNVIKDFKFSKKDYNKIRNSIIYMYKIFHRIINLLGDKDISILEDKNYGKRLNIIKSNIDGISSIFATIARLSIYSLPIIIGYHFIILSIECISLIINSVNKVFKDKEVVDIKPLDEIHDVVDKLFNIQKKLSLMILLTVPAIAGAIATCMFLLVLAGMIALVNVISKLVSTVAESAKKNFNEITTMISSILLVCGAILALALIAPIIYFIIKNTLIPFFAVLGGAIVLIVVMSIILRVVSEIAKKASIEAALNIILICGALIVASLAIIVAGVVGEQLNSGKAVWNVIKGILAMIIVATIMVALGLALSFAAPFIAMSMAGLGPLVGILGMVLIAGLSILALGKLTLDFGEYKTDDAYDPENGIFGKGKGPIGNLRLILDFVKYLLNSLDFEKSDKRKARRNKKVLKQVDKTIKEILDIAKKLESLSKITFNKDTLVGPDGKGGSVGAIFACVNAVEDSLTKFNKTSGDGATYRRDQIKTKRRMRRNAKVLSKVDKVINKIADITESLLSIKEFTLTPKEETALLGSGGSIEKIFECINKVDEKIRAFNSLNVDANGETHGIFDRLREIRAARKQKREYKHNAKSMSKVESIMLSLGGMVDSLNSIKEFTFEKETIGAKVETVMSVIETINNKITGSNKLPNNNEISKLTSIADYIFSIGEGAKGLAEADSTKLSKNIGSYGEFINKINTVEVTKLENATNMFKQMSEFSNNIKGDFKDLATSLSDKLLPVLEELKEVMSKVPEKIDQSSQNISASVNAANLPVNRRNVERQVKAENPEMTKEEIKKEVNTRMNERAQADANGIAAKIEELISLFKGYGGETAIVKTV